MDVDLDEIIAEQPPWMRDALCLEYAPDWWFPPKGTTFDAAKRVCGRCLVRGECLAYALDHKITEGVWGGLSPSERRRRATAA